MSVVRLRVRVARLRFPRLLPLSRWQEPCIYSTYPLFYPLQDALNVRKGLLGVLGLKMESSGD